MALITLYKMIEILILFANLSMELIIISPTFNRIINKDNRETAQINATIRIEIPKEHIIINQTIFIKIRAHIINSKITLEMAKTAKTAEGLITSIQITICRIMGLFLPILCMKCKELWDSYSICFLMEINKISLICMAIGQMCIISIMKMVLEMVPIISIFMKCQQEIEYMSLTIKHNRWNMKTD